jgi:hypothetical protein
MKEKIGKKKEERNKTSYKKENKTKEVKEEIKNERR